MSSVAPVVAASPEPSDGEIWWNRAVEKHSGEPGTVALTVPWQALSTHSLSQYFLDVLGAEGRARPLEVRHVYNNCLRQKSRDDRKSSVFRALFFDSLPASDATILGGDRLRKCDERNCIG